MYFKKKFISYCKDKRKLFPPPPLQKHNLGFFNLSTTSNAPPFNNKHFQKFHTIFEYSKIYLPEPHTISRHEVLIKQFPSPHALFVTPHSKTTTLPHLLTTRPSEKIPFAFLPIFYTATNKMERKDIH